MSPLLQAIIATGFAAVLALIVKSVGKIYDRIATMELTLSALDTKVSPLWAKVQAQIAADLHKPHPRYAEMDKLLEQLETLSITLEGRARLKLLLRARSTDMHADISETERAKALLMITVMDMVLTEKAGGAGGS